MVPGGNTMLALLPTLFFLLVAVAAASRGGLRHGFVVATIVYTICVVAATELLSLPALLRLPQVATFWAVAAACAALWLWRNGSRQGLRRRLRHARTRWAARRMELAGVALVLAVVFLIGVLSPPNNWESMAYRMVRVVMWLQQGSVAHYATPYLPQLYHSPLLSWHAMHLQLLAGGDWFANAAEWLGLVGCAIVASLLARELRQTFRVQVLAAVLAATLPMGLLQGSSTQGNVLAAYWLLCAVLLFLQHLRRPTWWRLACCGAAVGFTVLTKPTMYVIGPPVALALGFYGALACRRPKRTVGALAAALVIAGAMNVGHYARNWDLSSHPVSAPGHGNHVNERFGIDILAANLLRNSLLHWGLPWGKYNQALLEATAEHFPGVLDLPEATWHNPLPPAYLMGRFTEMNASNFLHYWLLAASAIGLACLRGWALPAVAGTRTRYLLGGWLLAVLAFSGVFVFEQWNGRYDVGLFMLGCPLAATFLAAASRKPAREKSLRAAAGLFLVASCPWLLFKESAPVFKLRSDDGVLPAETILAATRTRAYFNQIGGRPQHLGLVEVADAIAQLEPSVVGLHNPNRIEFSYPIYVLLRKRMPSVRLRYYDVNANLSAALESGAEWPDVVVKALAGPAPLRGEGTVYRTHAVFVWSKAGYRWQRADAVPTDQGAQCVVVLRRAGRRGAEA